MDAPWRYRATVDGGLPTMTIDQVPLHWCMQPGVQPDFRHFADRYVVAFDEIDAELARIGHSPAPLEICPAQYEARALPSTRRVVRTDAWSWDAPFSLRQNDNFGNRLGGS
jgi:Putative cyclase